MQKKQNSFLLYSDLETPFNFLSLEDRGLLITYIFQYVRLGDVDLADASDLVKLAFSMIRVYLDRDREQYEEKCRINAENGKKGGRPRKTDAPDHDGRETETEETDGLQTQAKKAYNNNNNNNNYDLYNNDYLGCGGKRKIKSAWAKIQEEEKHGNAEAESSFDADIFFQAALKRSYENI